MKRMMAFIFITGILVLPALPVRADWSPPVRISEPGDCWYPDILAQGDTLHVAYTNSRGGDKISYIRSTDGGERWSPHRALSDTVNTGSTRYARVLKHGASILVVWRMAFLDGLYTDNIGYRTSSNNGVSWSAPEYVLDHNWQRPFYMTAAGADTLVSIFMSTALGDSAAFLTIRSTDFGQTWSSPRRIFSAYDSGRSDIAVSDSFVHFCWGGQFDSNSNWETYYLRSTNAGTTWSDNVPLSEVDQYHSYNPAICTNGRVGVELTWMDFKYAPPGFTGDIFSRQSNDRGSNWASEVQITVRHESSLSDIVSIAETLYVVWQDERPENSHFSIYFSQSTDGGQTWSEECRLDEDSLESRQPALAASNGRVYVIWADRRCDPDTDICGGIYFTKFPAEPDAIRDIDKNSLPQKMGLSAYPNPFNSRVVIAYSSTKGGDIKIINSLGQLARSFKVDALLNGQIIWDGRDQVGHQVTSGVYFVRLQAGGQSKVLKLIYVK